MIIEDDSPTRYKIIDRRTGRRVSMATYGPLWLAHRTIVDWRQRDSKGKRPDIHYLIPHLAVAIEDWEGLE